MAGTRLSRISAEHEDTLLALCTLLRVMAAVVGAGVLTETMSGGGSWMAIGAGVAFGVMAPRRWGATIGGAAVASLAAMAIPGIGVPTAALLVLPGAVAGSWLRPRIEPVHPVSWIDAMLIGAASEVVILALVLCAAYVGALLLMPIWLFLSPLLWYLSIPVMLLVGFVGIHVRSGREVDRMLPGRFGGVALGQALPAVLLAVALGEPLVLLAMALPGACLWVGRMIAKKRAVECETAGWIAVAGEEVTDGNALAEEG